MGQRILYTVGHSTRAWGEFVGLMKGWGIEEVVDVRTVPRSRAFAWFCKETMAVLLPAEGIGYFHLAALGGLRHSKKGSGNGGWRNASFRGYADYMQTAEFEAGLAELNARRRRRRVCVMCAEAVWWRCHRRMIADAEVARGIPVRHIMSATTVVKHELTAFAVVRKGEGRVEVRYPEG